MLHGFAPLITARHGNHLSFHRRSGLADRGRQSHLPHRYCGAYPVKILKDPTGAGDTLAGGLVGYLSWQKNTPITFQSLKHGVASGSLMASFCVESFSVDRLASLSKKEMLNRFRSVVISGLDIVDSMEELRPESDKR